MLFALLGDDQAARQMAHAVMRHPAHELVATYETNDEVNRSLPPVDADSEPATASRAGEWESLLSGAIADAVIVARAAATHGMDRDRRDDQLRKLVQAGIPLLISHPACESIVGFELDMIRRDTGCVMQAFAAGIMHPAIEELAGWLKSPRESPIGAIEQLTIERATGDDRFDQAMVRLARDAAMVRRIAGPLKTVSAIGGLPIEGEAINLTIGIGNDTVPAIRWSIAGGRTPQRRAGHLMLIGTDGTARLDIFDEFGRWHLDIEGLRTASMDFADYDPFASQLEQFAEAVAAKQAALPWIDFSRDAEVAEAAKRSAQRGRQVELYQDEPTEAGTFKGMMAAGGCLLLMVSLAVLIGAAVVEGLRLPFRDHFLWRIWPIYLVAPLLFFLVLQTLNLVAKPPATMPPGGDSRPAGKPLKS